jgi:RimJ/RimL family protein N-acetyltransferase
LPVLGTLKARAEIVLDPTRIGFRRLQTSDLPVMHRWLNTPHVSRWYGEGPSQREVEEEYAPRIAGSEPVEPYLILYDDSPIGYIQGYHISHDEEYARLVDVEDSAGVDLFIGEVEYLHRGLGSHILRRFLGDMIFQNESLKTCVIGPEPKNTAAVRAYEKAGFRYFKTIRVPGEPEPEHLMKLSREAFEAGSVV